jgi:PAS domain S-box-containing protein
MAESSAEHTRSMPPPRPATPPIGDEAFERDPAAYFRTVFDLADAMIWVQDPEDGAFLVASQGACEVAGYTVEEYKQLGLDRVAWGEPPYTMVNAMQHLRRAQETGAPHRFEWCTRHRDGHPIFVEVTLRTVEINGAQRVLATGRSIDDRKAAEAALLRANEALRQSEEHFRRLIEHSYDLVQVLDREGRITYTGPSVHRLLGYTPEEIAGCTIADYMHPDDLPAATALVAQVFANPGVSVSLEYRVRHRDGSWRWMEAFARTLSPTSAEEGLVANARDITDRKAAQLAVEESEARHRSLIEAAQDVIAVIDEGGIYRFLSPSARDVLGFEPEELVGRNSFDFMHPDDVAKLIPRMEKVMASPGTVECVEYRHLHRDGSWRYLESRGRTILPDASDAGAVALVRDVTGRVETEAALRQAKADAEEARLEAERANRAKSEFLSRMSHELRTPLNSILGFAQVLEDVEMAPEYRTGVRHILNGGRHLLRLINEVLDIARIETDQHALSLEPVRLGVVVREAVDMVRPLAAARGIRVVEVSDATADRFVRADRQRLAQVLLNLLSNAVKYNRPGGTAYISCEPVVDGEGVERLRVCVADQGSGIAPEHRDRLFVPFDRLGAEHSGVEGTGLGLSLSRHLARAMCGELALECSGPEGSVFRVDLRPAADPLAEPAAVIARSRPGAAESLSAGTLLYVEDNLANLALVETILRPRPHWRLIPALQGGLGLELAAEHAPDVVLLDLNLPDMPGREVLNRLRADPRTAHIPVVVISADATSRTVEALTAAGADAFLTKPLDVREFVETVERLLTRSSGGS